MTKLLSRTGGTNETRSYNLVGSTDGIGSQYFYYNDNNRLSQYQYGESVTVDYTYNAFGERVVKDNGSDETLYVYDGPNLLHEQTGSVGKDYIYLDGQIVGFVTNSTLYFVHYDHIGRPEIISDSSSQVVWAAENNAFGNAPILDAVGGFNVGFPGQYYDVESGTFYNYFRTYDPSTGRYLESDPIGLGGGLNTYGYVGGNPLSGIDPLGLYEGDGQFPGPDPGATAAAMAREAAAQQRQAQRNFERYQELCRGAGGSNCDQPQQGPFNESSSAIGDACEILGATVGLYAAGQGLSMSRLWPPRTYVPAYPSNPGQIQHIFRNRPGHIADTPANRRLLQNVASNPANRVGTDKHGTTWWSRSRSDGSQVWVRTRGGVIQNGGVNPAPPLPPGM